MNDHRPAQPNQRSIDFPVRVGCPLCRCDLHVESNRILCDPSCERSDCPRAFDLEDGFPNLIIGERFEDDSSDELLGGEENNSTYTVNNYWVPRFSEVRTASGQKLRVLSLGCGAGMEIDMLRDAGFDAVGIDNGNRTRVWSRRTHKNALLMANGMHLPFDDETFDVAFCGCVFPHVGVVGDSFKVSDRYWQNRLAVASEMTRVVKRGGSIFVSSPNRLFPVDLFHGRPIGSYKPPINPPWRPFLLSRRDYARLFKEAGCQGPAKAMSIKGYWGFCRTKTSLLGRLMSVPVKALFALGSPAATSFLRSSPLLPWIVVRITR